jgi:hypothetical protein
MWSAEGRAGRRAAGRDGGSGSEPLAGRRACIRDGGSRSEGGVPELDVPTVLYVLTVTTTPPLQHIGTVL